MVGSVCGRAGHWVEGIVPHGEACLLFVCVCEPCGADFTCQFVEAVPRGGLLTATLSTPAEAGKTGAVLS